MKLDSTTAKLLLETVTPDNHEDIADLVKIFSVGKGPTKEQIEWFVVNKGKVVSIKGTSYTGRVLTLNTATGGFYEGSRYPIYVKLDSDVENPLARNAVFEYGLESILILNEGE